MKNGYLEPCDRDAFLDFPPPAAPEPGRITCLKCQGHGGWNLRVNAYGFPIPNTPENRHKYTHFRAGCDNCNGWGVVPVEQEDHIHEWVRTGNAGNCLHVYRCESCRAEQIVDSSD